MPLLKYQRNRFIVLIVALLLGGVVFLMYQGILPGIKRDNPVAGPSGPPPVTLTMWNVFEGPEVYAELLADYKVFYPNVTINYKKIDYSEYRNKLNQSFIDGVPPDIYAIHNTWLPLEERRIYPAPGTLAAVNGLDEIFPSVVKLDFTREFEGQAKESGGEQVGGARVVYALPLSIETLGLFYNKDYFEAANITSSPKTWEEFLDYVKLFTQFDDAGEIKLSGAALGSAQNINRATDILTLMMMQGGARMNNELFTEATFDEQVWIGTAENQKRFSPGEDALKFYLSFADSTTPVYSWDKSMPYSIDAFVEGKTAMIINYPHQLPLIASKAPHLNFGTGAMMQFKDQSQDINYANYWGFTVAKTSASKDAAWQLIDFLLKPENLKKYLTAAKLPTAHRDLILWQQQDPLLRPFVNQVLSAKSWYQGDSLAADKILQDTITSALVGEQTNAEALEDAAARITVLIQKTIQENHAEN